jgi:hypothetical protein
MNPLPGITGSFVGSINCQRAESAGIFPQSRVPEFTVFLKIGKGFRVFRMGIKEQCDIIDSKADHVNIVEKLRLRKLT